MIETPRLYLWIEVDSDDLPDGSERLVELICQARAREFGHLEKKLRQILSRDYGVSLSFRRTQG